MSKNNNGFPPPFNRFDDNALMQRPSPPSYEESLRQQSFQQLETQQPAAMHNHHNPAVYGYPHMHSAYAVPTVINSQGHVPFPVGTQSYAFAPRLPILELAKGAEIRTTSSGAISIPPPPPGCAPTPAQMAAMQGKSVLVKEPKKRAFFS